MLKKKGFMALCAFFLGLGSVSAQTVEDIAGRIVGLNAASKEIIVKYSDPTKPLLIGDRLNVIESGKIIVLEVTAPMQTLAKCRSVNASEFSMIRKGSPAGRRISESPKNDNPSPPPADIEPTETDYIKGYMYRPGKLVFLFNPDLYKQYPRETVYVAGKMNDWSRSSSQWKMEQIAGTKNFRLTVTGNDIPTSGTQFRFVTDGWRWTNPKNKINTVHNGIDGYNLILKY